MSTDHHVEPPPDDGRCGCAGCSDFRSVHTGFSLEVPWHERAAKRDADRAQQRRLEDHAAEQPRPMRRAV